MSKARRARASVASPAAAPCSSPPLEPNTHPARRGTFLASGIIVLAALIVYHNSFTGSFITEDHIAITDNPSIRQWGNALFPPSNSTVGGRPLLNLTFSLNYFLGGMNPWGYHAFNLLVHM